MKKLFVFLLFMSSTAFMPVTGFAASQMLDQAANFKEGVHYTKIAQQPTDAGDNVEVLEFFWYGCPHCYSFEPYLSAWEKSKAKNVTFTRVPAVFRPEWEVQARSYYALSNMGKVEEIHNAIFTAMHKDKKRLEKKAALVNFIVKHGVDRETFLKEYDSFAVNRMVQKAKKKQKAFQIQGVPAVIINGKYMTSGKMAGSYDNMVKIIDHLADKEAAVK